MTEIHVRPGEGRVHAMIDGDHVAKAAVDDGTGSFEVFEVFAPAGVVAPPHVSPWTGVLYLLEGRASVTVEGTTYGLEPGSVAVMPAGKACLFSVPEGTVRLLVVTSGQGAGRFFADFAEAVPADRPIEESFQAILDVTGRHGVSVAG